MKKNLFLIGILTLLQILILFQRDVFCKHKIWGEAGYLVNYERIKKGHEYLIPEYNENDTLKEIERWRVDQKGYLTLNFRYDTYLDIVSDFTIPLSDEDSSEISTTVQELYLTFFPSYRTSFRLGKQRLEWGSSKVFNSIDKLEDTPNPFSTRVIEEGLSGIKTVLMLSEIISFSILILPESELRWSRFALRGDFLLWDTDIGIGLIKYNLNHLDSFKVDNEKVIIDDFHVNNYDTVNIEVLPSKRDRFAGFIDLARYFGNYGIYSEFEYRYSRENEYAFFDSSKEKYIRNEEDFLSHHVFRLTTGFHYEMSKKPFLRFIAEYFYNSEGFTNSEAKRFYKKYIDHKMKRPDLPMILPQQLRIFGNFRQHYLYLGLLDIELKDYMSLGFSLLSNIETFAFNFAPEITLNIDKTVFINIKYDLFHQSSDNNENPSYLSLYEIDQRVTLSVKTNF